MQTVGSHLTIQQVSHRFHLRLLGAVALQRLFIAFGVGRHYAVVRQSYRCRQFLQLQATQRASQIQHQVPTSSPSVGRRRPTEGSQRRQTPFLIVYPAFFLAPIHLQDLSWRGCERKVLSISHAHLHRKYHSELRRCASRPRPLASRASATHQRLVGFETRERALTFHVAGRSR